MSEGIPQDAALAAKEHVGKCAECSKGISRCAAYWQILLDGARRAKVMQDAPELLPANMRKPICQTCKSNAFRDESGVFHVRPEPKLELSTLRVNTPQFIILTFFCGDCGAIFNVQAISEAAQSGPIIVFPAGFRP